MCCNLCPKYFLNQLVTNANDLFSGAQDVSIYEEGAYTESYSQNVGDNKIQFCIVAILREDNILREK